MKQFLVFDIETGPIDWNDFSDSQKEYWLRGTTNEEEVADRMFMRSLTPMTGRILCIGLMVVEKDETGWSVLKKGVLSLNPQDTENIEITNEMLVGDVKMQLSNEKRILEDFWKILQYYKQPTLITFNGRNFDIPFIMLRSAIHRIRPPFNLMSGTKFNYPNHIDLIDELTYYAGSQWGATKKFNFDFYAHTFGIDSPKVQGVDGSKVHSMFADGKIKEISEYCLRDVNATYELFLFWNEFLNFNQI
jgi:DNA polymerase elongation subunit (family B)